MATSKKVKVPKTIGAALDYLYQFREQRKLLAAQVEELKRQEGEIEEQIFGLFKKDQLEGARGKLAQASVVLSTVPTVKDWDAFGRYILKHKALDLLQRRVSVEAARERWKVGEALPGVDKFDVTKLHLTKVK